MTFTGRVRIAAAGAAVMLAVGAASAYAGQTSTVTVGATVINGTRTLTVKSLTGTQLGALTLGTGHAAAFLVNVSDINYAHVGYQVTATMSNLYPYDGSYHFDQQPIPSSAVSVAFPQQLVDVANVSTLVTPIVQLASTAVPFSALTPFNATVDGVTQSVQTLQQTLTQSTMATLGDKLPIRVAAGTAGAFTQPAAVTGQPGTFSPTARDVLDGTKQSLSALLTDLVNKLQGTATTAQDLISAGVLDENTFLASAASALGETADQLTSTVINELLTGVHATVTGLDPLTATTDQVLGQTGSYNAMPQLALTLPAQQPAGSYQGELTLTLMDN